jgi:hypothetical protein
MFDSTGRYDVESPGIYKLGIVHSTQERAEFAIRHLGLKGAVPLDIGTPHHGRRFVKIAVLYDYSRLGARGKQYVAQLRAYLVVGGVIIDLSW